MTTSDHELSIDEVDRLLGGHVPTGRPDLAAWASDLASLAAAYDREVDPVAIRRWAAEAAAIGHLAPTDNGDLAATPASNANRPARQAAGLPKRRIPVLDSIAAFLATTLGKTVAAGALVAATTTGGLAATGNLPGQSDPAVPVIVEDDTTDPGGLHVGDQDDDADEGPSVAGTVDEVDDDECVVDPAAVASAEVTSDDSDDAADSDDEADDDCDDEVEAVDDDVEADDLDSDDDADEVDESDDDSADESDDESSGSDDAADSDEVVTSDDGADSSDSDGSGSSGGSGSSDDDGDTAPTPGAPPAA